MDLDLQGKAAIVTGASKGIGMYIAEELAKEGVEVAICARNVQELETTARALSASTGKSILPIPCDVTSTEQVEAMVERTISAFGRLDILVNNAGVPGGLARGPLETVTDEAVMQDLDTKYMGYLRCARAAVPHMRGKGWGRIVNIGGMSGRRSGTYSTGARNIAIAHMTKTLSEELGQYGITANLIHPGATWTERWIESAEAQGKTLEEYGEELGRNIAIGRAPHAREIAYVAAFLASPKSVSITGETFSVSGGFSREVRV